MGCSMKSTNSSPRIRLNAKEDDRTMRYTEEKLKLYASPLYETEQEKCKHAIEMVRDALAGIGYTERATGLPARRRAISC